MNILECLKLMVVRDLPTWIALLSFAAPAHATQLQFTRVIYCYSLRSDARLPETVVKHGETSASEPSLLNLIFETVAMLVSMTMTLERAQTSRLQHGTQRSDPEFHGRHRPMFIPSHASSSTTHTSPSTPRPDGLQQKVWQCCTSPST